MRKIYLFLFAALTLLTSCNNYMDDRNDDSDDNKYITFKTDGFLEATTRGASLSAENMSSFGMTAAIYPAADSYTTAACGSYFQNVQVTTVSGTCGYYWPGNDYKLSFYAYAPYNAVTVGSAETTGHPIYTYTVPSTVSLQADFVTASVTDHAGTKTDTPVALTFSHKCAALRFHITNDNSNAVTITSIGVYGVKYSGTYKEDRTPKWVLSGSTNTTVSHPFLLTLNTSLAAGAETDIAGASNQFVILPQTVTSGTDLFILQTVEDGISRTYTYTLTSDLTLAQGTFFTYNITIKDKNMIVDTSSDIGDWDEETKYLAVASATTNGTFTQPSVNNGKVVGVENWTEEE